MRKLKISTGKSRFSKTWKNTEIEWSTLLARISTTTRTRETHDAYLALSKSRQDEIKDIGGFVGGWLRRGLRRSENVECRSILTLDLDYASVDFWETFSLVEDFTAAIYSTHKHTMETPRLRLIIPLDRDVSPDEYEAIARKIAARYGMEQFDDTTYQPSRLMYWPSTAADGEYVYEHQEGGLLEVDAVLAEYPDWKDISTWPRSSRENEIHIKRAGRVEDPLLKDNLVGAFCRAHPIREAIGTFLSNIYTPVADGQRYTFTGGSTSAGLVIYDDKFAFSNHSSDPAGGLLCNAFDLVRIHKFREHDVNAKEGTPSNRLPSYSAMLDFAKADEATDQLMIAESYQSAQEEFEGLETEDEDKKKGNGRKIDDVKLKRDRRGVPEPTIDNASIILEHDPKLANIAILNEFSYYWDVLGPLPWNAKPSRRQWEDNDDAGLRKYLEKVWGYTGRTAILDALSTYATAHSYHPVRDFLDTLVWDGIERLDTLLIDYLGATDEPYTRAITRKAMTAAIARIYEPGCKFDTMLTLVGPQGIGKSTFIRKLSKGWMSDSLLSVGSKESYEAVQGVWFIEMAELAAANRSEIEATKQFISKQEDAFRAAYARRKEVHPRQCVFWATTNDFEVLRDPTGNRRYWPVDVGVQGQELRSVFTDLDDDTVDQVLAEAKARYRQKEPLYLESDIASRALEIQADHTQVDPWQELIEAYFTDHPEVIKTTAAMLWVDALGNLSNYNGMAKADAKRINAIVRGLPGWDGPKTIKIDGKTPRGFIKKGLHVD